MMIAQEVIQQLQKLEPGGRALISIGSMRVEIVSVAPLTNWKPGPLPPDTWGWGGVVPHGKEMLGGFFFADFCGDHVKVMDNDKTVLKPWEVAWYNNGLHLPPCCSAEGGRI